MDAIAESLHEWEARTKTRIKVGANNQAARAFCPFFGQLWD
jgi:hypothetical protein